MPKVSVSTGSGERSWENKEKFTGLLINDVMEKLNSGDKARILFFQLASGDVKERWSTALWDRLIDGDKERKTPAMVKIGDCLEVEALEEVKIKGKGGKRFRPFVVQKLTGKDIPKSLR